MQTHSAMHETAIGPLQLTSQGVLVGPQSSALRGSQHDLGVGQQAELREVGARVNLLGDLGPRAGRLLKLLDLLVAAGGVERLAVGRGEH